MSLVTVVIPNWNGKHWLEPCLTSLSRQTFRDFSIIVVENGSTDESKEYLETNWPDVTVLAQPKNLGFAGGVNAGIRASKSQYIALFNNDATADPRWLEQLVHRLEQDDNTGAATSKMLTGASAEHYEFDSTGDFYSIWGRPYPRGRGVKDTGQYESAQEVFSASGGATLYRSRLFAQIGLFDEEFFAYYEDTDLSFRARLAGWKIWYEPTAIVYHNIGGTSGGGASSFSRYQSVKNQWYLYLKDMPARLFWQYLPRFLFLQILFYGNAFLTGLAWAHTKSVLRGLLMTPSMLLKRHRIQAQRKLSSRQIDTLLTETLPPGLGPNFYRYFGWLAKKERS